MDEKQTFRIPFRRLDPAEMLTGRAFYEITSGQILFFYPEWESFVITEIADQDDFTVQSYDLLPEGAPFQLIHGKLIHMAAPEDIHQAVLGNIFYEIKHFLKQNKLGKVRIAPEDVVLDEKNVVQPDLFFVSIKRNSIIDRKVYGAPDFVVEILSRNAAYDRGEKMELYAAHGVVEYWIVHPTEAFVEVYHNENKVFRLVQTAQKSDTIASVAIEGFVLQLADVFDVDA